MMRFGHVSSLQLKSRIGAEATAAASAVARIRIRSLRWRILLPLGSILILTLIGTGQGVSRYLRETQQTAWQQRQREAAISATDIFSIFLEGVQDTLFQIGVLDPDYLNAHPDVLQTILRRKPALLEVVSLDRDGVVLAHATQEQELLTNQFTLHQSVWYQRALSGESYTGKLQIASNGVPYVILSQPTTHGVIAARLQMKLLWDIVAGLRFGENGMAFVIDRNGLLIAHPDSELVLRNTTLFGRPEMDFIGASADATWNGIYTDLHNVTVVGTSVPIPNSEWVMLTELPVVEAYAVANTANGYLAIGLSLCGLLLLGLGTYVLNRYFFQPMRLLEKGVHQIGEGDLTRRVDVLYDDEIGQVAIAFNEMAATLQDRDETLSRQTAALQEEIAERKATQLALLDAHALLEQRVIDRTAELAEKALSLEQSNQELQQFAYISSHDLQEPLRKVRTFGDRLKARYAAQLDERGVDYIDRMQNAAERMQVLIDSLLSYSRVTTKAKPSVSVELNSVVAGVISDLEPGIEQVKGHIEVHDLPVVQADPMQMRQLFQNLIGNALKFHRPDVPPMVVVNSVPTPYADRYLLQITDNGIGFEQTYAERIFQPFERLHSRSVYEGTGIGLAIVRKIVERHGGQIEAQSTPGQGSTFTFSLPAVPAQTEGTPNVD